MVGTIVGESRDWCIGAGRAAVAANPQPGCAAAPMATGTPTTRVSTSQGGAHMFRTIIWATDGSDNSDRALGFAKELAQESACSLVAVHSKELLIGRAGGFPLRADEEDVETKISRQVEELKDVGIDARTLFTGGRAGHAAHSIAEAADSLGADLIVVGTRGQTAFAGLMLGSITQRLLHVARCPVLAVPPTVQVETVTAPQELEEVR
jgi:nucleotide-binding universal stress UspA family protein